MSGFVRTSEEIGLWMNRGEIMPGGWGETREILVLEWLVRFCKWAGLRLPVSAELQPERGLCLTWTFAFVDVVHCLPVSPRTKLSFSSFVITKAHLGTATWVATFSNRYTSQLLMRLLIQQEGFSGAHELVLDHCFLKTEAEHSAYSSRSSCYPCVFTSETVRVYWAPSMCPRPKKPETVSTFYLYTSGNYWKQLPQCPPSVPVVPAQLQVCGTSKGTAEEQFRPSLGVSATGMYLIPSFETMAVPWPFLDTQAYSRVLQVWDPARGSGFYSW